MRIGLTGGIGSGKSTVAAILARLGAWLIDTDAIARALTAPRGAALPAIAAAFGPGVIDADGALDRERMRARVFADREAKRRLEAVLHPMIGVETERLAAQAGARPIVFDVPLLAEIAHWRTRMDRVLVVDCSEATQIDRVMLRSGWQHEAVRRVVAQQAPRALRRSVADAVIHNDAISLRALEDAVTKLYTHWTGTAPRL